MDFPLRGVVLLASKALVVSAISVGLPFGPTPWVTEAISVGLPFGPVPPVASGVGVSLLISGVAVDKVALISSAVPDVTTLGVLALLNTPRQASLACAVFM
jgi:hypothetical protein